MPFPYLPLMEEDKTYLLAEKLGDGEEHYETGFVTSFNSPQK
jgi:hypothetical protein